MRQILIFYATIHLILLASSVRCDGTYQISLIFMLSLHEVHEIIPSWDGRVSISRYFFLRNYSLDFNDIYCWKSKKNYFVTIIAIIVSSLRETHIKLPKSSQRSLTPNNI
jgi:hypothetical protein